VWFPSFNIFLFLLGYFLLSALEVEVSSPLILRSFLFSGSYFVTGSCLLRGFFHPFGPFGVLLVSPFFLGVGVLAFRTLGIGGYGALRRI